MFTYLQNFCFKDLFNTLKKIVTEAFNHNTLYTDENNYTSQNTSNILLNERLVTILLVVLCEIFFIIVFLLVIIFYNSDSITHLQSDKMRKFYKLILNIYYNFTTLCLIENNCLLYRLCYTIFFVCFSYFFSFIHIHRKLFIVRQQQQERNENNENRS